MKAISHMLAPVVRNVGAERELTTMRWGMPTPPRNARSACYQYPQHIVIALARLAEARKPMPGPGKQLRRVRAGAEPGDEEKRRSVVRALR